MNASLVDFCTVCREGARLGHVHDALMEIRSLVWRAGISRQAAIGRLFASRALDEACLAIGALEPAPPSRPDRSGTLYLVTELQRTGGHTRVLGDLLRAAAAEAGERITILATDILGQHDTTASEVFSALDASVEVAPAVEYGARLAWIKARMAQLSPRVTRTLLHPFDSVGVAALQPELVGELTFLHNADHNLSLGVTLSQGTHVDFHAKGFYNCRENEGVHNNVVWPLTVEDLGPRRPGRYKGAPLKTCSAGGFEKFESTHLGECSAYLYAYADVAPLIPAATGGEHVHIGPLSDETLTKIRDGLSSLGVDPARFVHMSFVPKLWESLLALDIDVYVGSFPLGGGRATVEALGAGLPLCIHSNYRSVFLSAENEVYEGALIWRTPEQLIQHLRALTPGVLESHSKASRLYYEEHHRPELLSLAMKGWVRDWPRPRHSPDRLQAYLDEIAVGT